MLTTSEWAAQQPPIYWVDLPDWTDNSMFMRSLIDKWCDVYLDEWWYRNFHTFAFGSERDRTTFLMFYKSNVWDGDYGELLPKG